MTSPDLDHGRASLRRRRVALERITLEWNAAGVVVLTVAVLAGISLNAAVGWWWADSAAGLVIVYDATREAHHIFTDQGEH